MMNLCLSKHCAVLDVCSKHWKGPSLYTLSFTSRPRPIVHLSHYSSQYFLMATP